jgi:drug/metabolite transporter (DMT)-like permease
VIMQSRPQYWYYILAVIPPFMGAVSNVLSKYSINDISPVAMLFWRWVIAVLLMTPFVMRGFIAEFHNIKAAWRVISIAAFFGIALFNLFVYCGVQYTTSTSSSIIISVFPIFVMLLGFLINNDRPQMIQIIAITVSLSGALVIVSHGNVFQELTGLFDNYGDFLALMGTICYAIYVFTVKFKPDNLSFYSFSYSAFLLGMILLCPLYLFDVFYVGNRFELNGQNIVVLLSLGVGVSVIGMLIFNMTILKLGYNLASIIFYLMPLFTSIMAVTILDEKFECFHFIGMSLILIGVNLPILSNYIVLSKRR